MLPINHGGHTAYQDTFVLEFLKLFPNPFIVPKKIWDIIVKFWYLDLSETDSIMQEYYPLTGKPVKRFPSCMLRSYLLSIKLKITSITEWCRLLKINPLYAILSGFPVIDIENLSLAGDGTPIKTARLERSKRICDCPKGSDCGCKRSC